MATVRRKSSKIQPDAIPKKKKRGAPAKPFQKGNPGRPFGSKNKFTDLRNAFLDAFNDMGGAEELMRWGKLAKNRQFFYGMIAKMLPKEMILAAQPDAPENLPFRIVVEKRT